MTQPAENDALTDSGRRIGDECEAIVAEFVFGPQVCRKASVAVVTDATWGTTHVVCAEHTPRVIPPGSTATEAEGDTL